MVARGSSMDTDKDANNDNPKLRNNANKLQIRFVLYILCFTGLMMNYVLRTDINIAILAMTNSTATETSMASTIEQTNATHPTKTKKHRYYKVYIRHKFFESVELRKLKKDFEDDIELINRPTLYQSNLKENEEINDDDNDDVYDWDIAEQNLIQSAFYWWYFISSGVAFVFINRIGPTLSFGFGQLITGFGNLLIPFVADDNYIPVFIIKSIQGFAEGITWPAYYALVGRWIPPFERSRFLSATLGSTVGIGVSYMALGYVTQFFGWRYVFYFTGTLNTIWCIFWFRNVYDDPENHPKISEAELKLLQSKRPDVSASDTKLKTPWAAILKSPIVWAIATNNFGRLWIMSILFLYAPLYLKHIVHIEIGKNGFYAGLPYVISVFICFPSSILADYMIKHQTLQPASVRKLFTAIAQVFAGLLFLLIMYTKTAVQFSILSFVITCAMGCSSSGSMATIVDIAPNFSGAILGFTQLIFMSANFLCTLFATFVLEDVTSEAQWRSLFAISAVIGIVTYIPFHMYCTVQVQPWNYVDFDDSKFTKKKTEVKDNGRITNA